MNVFGVDIGGPGIKGAPVDLGRGELAQERHKVAHPAAVHPRGRGRRRGEVVGHFGWTGPVGVTFPGVVVDGHDPTAANVDKGWIGTRRRAAASATALGLPGHGPQRRGRRRHRRAAVRRRARPRRAWSSCSPSAPASAAPSSSTARLVPNTELGHLELHGHDAERRASSAAKEGTS